MKAPFNTANVRDITDAWFKEKITFSRMVEMLNEIAETYFASEEYKDYCKRKLHKIINNERNSELFTMCLQGSTIEQMTEKYGISKSRISQLLQMYAIRLIWNAKRLFPNDEIVKKTEYISFNAIRSNRNNWLHIYQLINKEPNDRD